MIRVATTAEKRLSGSTIPPYDHRSATLFALRKTTISDSLFQLSFTLFGTGKAALDGSEERDARWAGTYKSGFAEALGRVPNSHLNGPALT